jgi:hypothetical protein
MTLTENPQNTPTWTPTNNPSEDILRNFRATLEVRWAEFDRATMDEAQEQAKRNPFGVLASESDIRDKRNENEDFIKAKAAFDNAKTMLASIKDDEELKSNNIVLSTVESTLKSLTDHLKAVKPEEKWKKINIILENTTADLSKFKADITGKPEDQKSAEDARVSVATAVAAAWTWALATEAMDGLSKAAREWTESLAQEAEAIKKNPIKKIAEFFGFSETSIVSDFKTALSEKKAGWFDGFFGGIKVWFYGFLAKMFGTDLAKHLTPEELKLAGIAAPTVPNTPEKPKPEVEVQSVIDDISMKAWYKGFVRMYYNSIDGIDKLVKPTDIDSAFQYTPFLNMKYSEAQSLFEKYKSNHKWMSAESQFKWITNIEWAFAALALLVSWWSSSFLKNRFGNSLNNLSVREIFVGIKDSFDIAESIEDIEIGAFEDVTGFMWKIGEKMDISIKDGKISQEGMKVKAEKLWLGNPKLIAFTLFQAANQPIADFQTNESIDKLDPLDLEWKKKLREIIAFWKSIMPVLIKNCSFWESQKYAEEFNKINPTLSDITKMYITLGWNTNFSTMSQAQHLYCYQRTWHLLGNTKFRGEHFDQPMIQALINDSQNILSPEMKDTFKRLMSRAFTKFMDKMSWIAGEIYGAMKWYHIASVGTVIGAYLLWWKKLAWIGQWAAIASLAMIVSNVLASVSSVGSDGKYTLSSGTKITKEEWAEALINEASRIWVK